MIARSGAKPIAVSPNVDSSTPPNVDAPASATAEDEPAAAFEAIMAIMATARIGPMDATPVRPKLLSLLFLVDADTPRPSARMNGTARGPVVAPLASKLMEAIAWPITATNTNTIP